MFPEDMRARLALVSIEKLQDFVRTAIDALFFEGEFYDYEKSVDNKNFVETMVDACRVAGVYPHDDDEDDEAEKYAEEYDETRPE